MLFLLLCQSCYFKHLHRAQRVRACSRGSGGPRRGEVTHLPLVKKCLSPCATLEAQGEVQNAITWSLITHKYKELLFVLVKLLFSLMPLLQTKLKFYFFWLAWLSNSTLKVLPALLISSVFWCFWMWNHGNNSPCSSDLITPVRQLTPLRGCRLPGQADRVT